VVVERDCIYMFWLENFLWVSTKKWDKCGWGGDLREVAFTCFEWRNSFGHLLKMRQGWLKEKNIAFYMFWMDSFSRVLGKKWEKGARRRRGGLHLHFLSGEILEGLKMRWGWWKEREIAFTCFELKILVGACYKMRQGWEEEKQIAFTHALRIFVKGGCHDEDGIFWQCTHTHTFVFCITLPFLLPPFAWSYNNLITLSTYGLVN
jgi:uncharacterized protein (DUF2132 family)